MLTFTMLTFVMLITACAMSDMRGAGAMATGVRGVTRGVRCAAYDAFGFFVRIVHKELARYYGASFADLLNVGAFTCVESLGGIVSIVDHCKDKPYKLKARTIGHSRCTSKAMFAASKAVTRSCTLHCSQYRWLHSYSLHGGFYSFFGFFYIIFFLENRVVCTAGGQTRCQI